MAHSIQSQLRIAVVSVCWFTATGEASCADTGSCVAIPSSIPDTESLPEVSLLQMAVNGHSNDAQEQKTLDKQGPQVEPGQIGAPQVAAFVPEIGTICMQGPDINRGIYVAAFRASPLNRFSPHAPWQIGRICADLGFPLLAQRNDACWPEMSIYVSRNDTNVVSELTKIREQSIDAINAYASSHNLDVGLVAGWVACSSAPSCSSTPVPANSVMWWGASQTYSPQDCPGIMNSVVPAIAAANPNIASFTTASGILCWEGPYDYLVDALNRVGHVPAAAPVFDGVTVQRSTCAARGFATVRDHRDECWMDSAKTIRTATENADIGAWAMGPPGTSLRASLLAYDVEHGLPEFTSVDLWSCYVCEAGGANRDRAMLVTNTGAQYSGRYTDAYCASVTAGI